jgi:hypothetical protein
VRALSNQPDASPSSKAFARPATPPEESGAGQAALVGLFIFAAAGLAGMVGASLASLIARLFDVQGGSRAAAG